MTVKAEIVKKLKEKHGEKWEGAESSWGAWGSMIAKRKKEQRQQLIERSKPPKHLGFHLKVFFFFIYLFFFLFWFPVVILLIHLWTGTRRKHFLETRTPPPKRRSPLPRIIH